MIINPNNPTGAVYSPEVIDALVEVARRHQLMVLSDEIYDKILYDGATHRPTALSCPDLICVTFNGLSKIYRSAGYRMGWMVITGPKEHAKDFLDGLEILANLRLGPNVPVQHAIQAALGGFQSIDVLVEPGGRLYEQRDLTWQMLNEIPGVSCTKPMGAIYAFPRLDPKIYNISDDERFVMDLLNAEKTLVMHGTAFNWPEPDHFRIVTLPHVKDLEAASTASPASSPRTASKARVHPLPLALMAEIREFVEGNAAEFFTELKDWLRIPSISGDPDRVADVRDSAEWLAAKLRAVGFPTVEVWETAGGQRAARGVRRVALG